MSRNSKLYTLMMIKIKNNVLLFHLFEIIYFFMVPISRQDACVFSFWFYGIRLKIQCTVNQSHRVYMRPARTIIIVFTKKFALHGKSTLGYRLQPHIHASRRHKT